MFSHLRVSVFLLQQTNRDLMALMINDVSAIRMATGLAFIALTTPFSWNLSLLFMFR